MLIIILGGNQACGEERQGESGATTGNGLTRRRAALTRAKAIVIAVFVGRAMPVCRAVRRILSGLGGVVNRTHLHRCVRGNAPQRHHGEKKSAGSACPSGYHGRMKLGWAADLRKSALAFQAGPRLGQLGQ